MHTSSIGTEELLFLLHFAEITVSVAMQLSTTTVLY